MICFHFDPILLEGPTLNYMQNISIIKMSNEQMRAKMQVVKLATGYSPRAGAGTGPDSKFVTLLVRYASHHDI